MINQHVNNVKTNHIGSAKNVSDLTVFIEKAEITGAFEYTFTALEEQEKKLLPVIQAREKNLRRIQ